MFIPDKLLETLRIYPKDEQEYMKYIDQMQLYVKWAIRTDKRIPELAMRIFNLRGKRYNGFGFQCDKERRLGNILVKINEYDDCPREPKTMMIHRFVMKTAVNQLFKDVVNAEKSIKR